MIPKKFAFLSFIFRAVTPIFVIQAYFYLGPSKVSPLEELINSSG